jgi:hypothetical protein
MNGSLKRQDCPNSELPAAAAGLRRAERAEFYRDLLTEVMTSGPLAFWPRRFTNT